MIMFIINKEVYQQKEMFIKNQNIWFSKKNLLNLLFHFKSDECVNCRFKNLNSEYNRKLSFFCEEIETELFFKRIIKFMFSLLMI
jgi:hypothetical protein